MTLITVAIVGYLIGSFPAGYIAGRIAGIDIRKAGSGNVGATNVARVAGPLAGIFTLVLDAAKGATPVWLAARFANDSAAWMTVAGLAALTGHCFPMWLRFRGGKGVAR